MKTYSDKISLVKNSRGIYCLDTSMGCSSGLKENARGCYGDCYSAKSAKIYGYDFSKTVLRNFKSKSHQREIISLISKSKLDFIRIGCSGDPSENWGHTILILNKIKNCNKEIVIITRHWALLSDEQLEHLSTFNICINTSISALDDSETMERCLTQYLRIKQYCKSILRIVSCDFNLENETGHKLAKIQADLFLNEDTLDTVFRPDKNNPFVLDGIVNVRNGVFNNNKQLMSKYNKKTYTGKCTNCKEMCGLNINDQNKTFPNKLGIEKQLTLL